MKTYFPSITAVTHELTIARFQCDDCDDDGMVDVRLQVFPDSGAFNVHIGDASFDTDHHGVWGSSALVIRGRQNMRELARDLISQCRDSAAL